MRAYDVMNEAPKRRQEGQNKTKKMARRQLPATKNVGTMVGWWCLTMGVVMVRTEALACCPAARGLPLRRRECLQMGGLMSALGRPDWMKPAVGKELKKPMIDVPLRRLRLPAGAFGRDYVLLELELPEKQGAAKEEFLVDTGLTLEMVTPALKERLDFRTNGGGRVEATSAGGTASYDVVEIAGARVEGLALPPLHAAVADFPMEHIDPQHDVTGMLGLEFCRLFDVDLDADAGRFRLWKRGDGAEVARGDRRMVEIPAAYDGSVLAVRVSGRQNRTPRQPFFGIVDSGASITILSDQAAKLAGVDDPAVGAVARRGQSLLGLGVDGKPAPLPIVDHLQLELDGDFDQSAGRFKTAIPLPDDLPVAVGDLPVFVQLLGKQRGATAAVLGIDIWSRGRTIFCGGPGKGPTSIFWSGAPTGSR